jgi:hypothetical protein
MAEQIRKHQMHYDPKVKGVWSGFGSDLNPVCGQREQILVTNVAEAVDCLKCLHTMEQSSN